jgi:hypothetical protein
LDLARDFDGEVEGAFGAFAADDGGGLFADAADEGLEFEFEGFVLFDGDGFAHDFFSAEFADDGGVAGGEKFFQEGGFFFAFAGDAVNETFLRAVIEGDVAGVRAAAEDADFAHAFGADAAGGEVRDATVRKTEAGVGDVLAFAQDGNADGIDAGDGRFDEGEDDVEIVDHEVEDDADVGAARWVGRKAMGLDEAWFGGDAFHVAEGGVEAFDVADLKDEAILLGNLDEFGGLGGGFGHGLLDEEMLAGGEELARDVEVGVRGRDDAERVGTGEGGFEGREDLRAALGGDLLGGGGVRIVNAGELEGVGGRGQLRVNAGVFLAERSGSNDRYSERFRHLAMVIEMASASKFVSGR